MLLPLVMLGAAVLPVYMVAARLMPQLLAGSFTSETSDFVAAVTIAVLLGVLWLSWVLPLAYCWWSYHWVARYWQPPSSPGPNKQVDDENGNRRRCFACNIFMADRTYHCPELGKCLPLYDHFCKWWYGGVWVHNLKAYLLFLAFLPVYQVFVFGVGLWVVANEERRRREGWFVVGIGIACGVMLLVSVGIALQMWLRLVRRNRLQSEEQIWFRLDNGQISLEEDSPWNQGFKKNFCSIFGSAWSWPLFWTTTPFMNAADGFMHSRQSIEIRPLDLPVRSRRGQAQALDTKSPTRGVAPSAVGRPLPKSFANCLFFPTTGHSSGDKTSHDRDGSCIKTQFVQRHLPAKDLPGIAKRVRAAGYRTRAALQP